MLTGGFTKKQNRFKKAKHYPRIYTTSSVNQGSEFDSKCFVAASIDIETSVIVAHLVSVTDATIRKKNIGSTKRLKERALYKITL